jgi:hypothetical protein
VDAVSVLSTSVGTFVAQLTFSLPLDYSVANNAVREINGDPCSIAPFGVAVVNTTSNELVCVAANRVGLTGSEFRWFLVSPSRAGLVC